MNIARVLVCTSLFTLTMSLHLAQATPSLDKLNWGPNYLELTCKPAVKTRQYVGLWPLLTHQERLAITTAQQIRFVREQDLYRSWAVAFEEVLGNPTKVKTRGRLYPITIYEQYGLDTANQGASDTLAACVEHMAKQLSAAQ